MNICTSNWKRWPPGVVEAEREVAAADLPDVGLLTMEQLKEWFDRADEDEVDSSVIWEETKRMMGDAKATTNGGA